MTTRDNNPPQLLAGFWSWRFAGHGSQIVFLGKGPLRDRMATFTRVVDKPDLQLSWPRQVHSATVLTASGEGPCGEGDALMTTESGLALSVVTADCVPIIVEGRQHLAAIHAGWRGLAGDIIQETLRRFGRDSSDLRAWIGPAIGVCCYEVGRDVAAQVVAVSGPSVLRDAKPRPHLNLSHAAEIQLSQGGIEQIHIVDICTRCSVDWLASYRRDQGAAGRNLALAWRH